MNDADIAYDERGLVPCVLQDWRTGEVLTLAYMNAEALERTRESGEVHFWSRSRGELWHKGATSGNTQALRALRYDCDADALLALVEPGRPGLPHRRAHLLSPRRAGPAVAPHEALPALERTIAERAAATAGRHYTARLLARSRADRRQGRARRPTKSRVPRRGESDGACRGGR